MKRLATGLTSFSLLCLLSAGALADHHKDLKENIKISSTVWVNGTEVKPGNYLVRYNPSTSEMKLERGGKVIAQAKAAVVVSDKKFETDALLTRGGEDAMQLTGIRLGGEYEELQLVDVSTASVHDEAQPEVIDVWFYEFYE